jgi:16S rRNA (cytosine1402-N4)-methyltransferase
MEEQGSELLSHPSAMVAEVLAYLQVAPGGVYVDATIGPGGHAEAILRASAPDGRLLGIDLDETALEMAARRLASFGARVMLVQGRFSQVAEIAARAGLKQIDGLLADLAVSRPQLLDKERGFSFDSDARLDSRYSRRLQSLSAYEVVNQYECERLAEVLALTGKRRLARRLAEAIIRARTERPIESPRQLARVIHAALGRTRRGAADAASEWLMAVRMHVNDELQEAAAGIRAATKVLRPGGRLVVLAWDGTTVRVVRETLRSLARGCTCPPEVPCTCAGHPQLRLFTPRGRRPTAKEIEANRAARTCRLFAAEKHTAEEGKAE